MKALMLAMLFGVVLAVSASARAAQASAPAPTTPAPAAQHITTSYGYALYGDLKYPAGFTHFNFADPNAVKGGTVRLTGLGSYDSFNTFAMRGSSAISIANFYLYYDSLMRFSWDANSQFYCLICESLSYPDDFSWVEFKLRKTARWHDGTPITPEDVIFSFNMMKNQAAPAWRQGLVDVARVEKTGPLSVRFYPNATGNRRFIMNVGPMVIIPAHYWKGRDFTAPVVEPPLSSGPYQVSSFDLGRSFTLSRVKDYWAKDLPVSRGQYNYDQINYDYYRDTIADFEAFKAGYTDVRLEVDPCNWKGAYIWPAAKRHQVLKGQLPSREAPLYQGFFFNMRLPLFQDPRLREALSYAFDFTWLNKNLLCDQFVPSHSLFGNSDLAATGAPSPEELALLQPYRDKVPARVFGPAYQPPLTDGTQESLRNNLRKAAQMLHDAGYVVKDGKLISPRTHQPVAFEILIWDPTFQRPASNWVENMKLLGIDATLKTVDFPNYTARTRNFDFQVLIGLIPFLTAPGQELRNMFSSSSADLVGSFNWAGIKDPVVDAMVEKMISAKTRDDLLTAAHALDRVVMWNFYTLPNFTGRGVFNVAYWDRFGIPANPQNFGLAYLNSWWIDPKKDAVLKQSEARAN